MLIASDKEPVDDWDIEKDWPINDNDDDEPTGFIFPNCDYDECENCQ